MQHVDEVILSANHTANGAVTNIGLASLTVDEPAGRASFLVQHSALTECCTRILVRDRGLTEWST